MARPAWLVVARREFIERVRTGWFIFATLIGPVFMIGVMVLPVYLAMQTATKGFEFAVVDRSGRDVGKVLAAITPELEGPMTRVELVPPATPEADLRARIERGEIDGYLILPEDVMTGGGAIYVGENASAVRLDDRLEALATRAVQQIRARDIGLAGDKLERLVARVDVATRQPAGASGAASFFVGYALMFILYIAILLYALNVMRSVIQEKTSRVLEIMVSAVKPRELMLGKVLGVGGVGLLQQLIWAVLAVLLFRYRGAVLGLFGLPGAAMSVPPVAIGDLAVAILYFVIGFFFYASLYAAIGAMVNSEQEAQQAQTPLIILLIIPVMCVQMVAGDPRGGAAQILTLIPFSSAILMPMRWTLGGATAGELALSLAILVASTAGVIWLAARIYRVGILMYGKRPGPRELWRWIRYG